MRDANRLPLFWLVLAVILTAVAPAFPLRRDAGGVGILGSSVARFFQWRVGRRGSLIPRRPVAPYTSVCSEAQSHLDEPPSVARHNR
jgi:hypothetical protein